MPYVAGSTLLSFEVLGEAQIKEVFEGTQERLEDFSPALERIAVHFYAHMASVFETGGMATASGFAPLSRRYGAWKARHYPGKPILTRKGELARSLTRKGARGNIHRVTKDTLTVGTRLRVRSGRWVLGTLHQGGTDKMPRRRIIDLPDYVKAAWMSEIREHINQEA